MKRTTVADRPCWLIHLISGKPFKVFKRDDDDDYLIINADISIQCPQAWLSIHRGLDIFNAPGSNENQTSVYLCMTAPEITATLATLYIDPNEYYQLENDEFLGALCTSSNLTKEEALVGT